jgi:phospholipid/cholesterol/gamma-HCH transport system ATP-binding protein
MASKGDKSFIIVRDLHKSFGDKQVLRGVDLEVALGETLVVLGGSGSGKSVLLRHLNGLVQPEKGEVVVDGIRLNDLDEDQMADVRKRVAMVFQLGALFDSMTVYENISYPLSRDPEISEEQKQARVRELLSMVELDDNVENLLPAELSGGMKKRVALARALALQPKAVLYDEPTTGLDPLVTVRINQLIRGLQKKFKLTSVVVTHDLNSAFRVGDRFALIDEGRIRFSGDIRAVLNTRDELMREFIESSHAEQRKSA